jgi:hypothetical protein
MFATFSSSPDGALARVFHLPAAMIYRIINSIGRNNIVETTVKTAAIPEPLLADEFVTLRQFRYRNCIT